LKDDLEFDRDAKEDAVRDRSIDLFGVGGFISGGDTTINAIDPDKIDVAAGIAYDSNGERIDITPAQTGITISDLTGGINYIYALYVNTTDTAVANPLTGVSTDTRTQESFSIIASLIALSTPYVPIAEVTKTQPVGPLVIVDKRVFVKDLSADSVGNVQLKTPAVSYNKLYSMLKPIIVDEDPGIRYDEINDKLIGNRDGSVRINGSLFSIDAFSYTPAATPCLVVGTLSTGPNVCAVSTSTVWDTETYSSTTNVLLGVINSDDTFVPFWTLTNGEIEEASEEETVTTHPRRKLIHNIQRRMNEGFLSFTATTDDGTPITDSNLIVVAGTDTTVSDGVSYVAGKRVYIPTDVLLDATNTENYALRVSNTIGIWMYRDIPVGTAYRFFMDVVPTPSPNMYKLGTVTYDGSGDPVVSSFIDERIFSPIDAPPLLNSESILPEIRCVNGGTGCVQLLIGPGTIGFDDGDKRVNTTWKSLLFNQPFNPSVTSVSVSEGRLDTATGALEAYSSYAIFAIANHPSASYTDWNIVASKIPFVKSVVTGVDK
jgi:hypothetical protein